MKYFISFLLLLSLPAFADNATAAEKFAPKNKARRVEDKIGEGIFDGPLYDSSSSGDKKQNCIGVNAYLWRGSLDAVSFLPKDHMDPFAGVITTQWYALPEAPNDQLRIEISILSQQLRADSLKVVIFKRTKDAQGNWKSLDVDVGTVDKFEEAILTKARALRIAEERK
jgi:hypothetical protein